MKRRQFLAGMAGGASTLALSNLIGKQAMAATDNDCFVPWSSDTPAMSWPKKEPPYSIALSNSYIGNTWRSEMVSIAKLYSEREDVKPLLKDFRVASAGNDVSGQIAQVNQMILSGVDAIVTDAASPTAMNSAFNRAVDAGILVVSFDNPITTDKAVALNQDQFEMGKLWAEFIVKHMGKKGHVLFVRGVAGTSVDIDRTKGGKSVFDKYPSIKTTEVYGKWDSGTAQKVAADALAASGGSFDGVWCQGGDDGVIRAFEDAGAEIPPIAGEAENGFRKYAASHDFPMLSIGQNAAMSAMSMKVAVEMMQGREMPQTLSVPFTQITNEDLEEGVNYFDDVPDSFFCGISIPKCGLTFRPKDILNTEV